MAKTLRTSGDYTIKAGAGAAGINEIDLDSKTVRVRGDLIVDGDQTTINTSTLSVEDTFVELNRNNSGTTLDGGMYVNRGIAGNNAVLFWDESADVFVAATTTDSAGTSPLTSATLANIRVATPSDSSDAATKQYVDDNIASGAMASFNVAADSGSTQIITDSDTLTIAGGQNVSSVTGAYSVTLNLDQNLTNIDSIAVNTTNGNLTLSANGTGSVVVNNILTFASTASDPAGTPTYTKIYHKTIGGGDTGIYFKNPSGTVGELISKKKATALAIALG